MNPIENILQKFPLVILDGAMATELERHGCDLNDSLGRQPYLWKIRSLSNRYIRIILQRELTVLSPPVTRQLSKDLPDAV